MLDTPFVAFDCETTGLTDEHVILSFAVVSQDYKYLHLNIQWENVLVSTKAMEINQIDLREYKETDINGALFQLEVWARTMFPSHFGGIVPIGFNVGSFDMRMLWNMYKRPETKSNIHYFPFHRRHVDLNSCLFLLGIDKKPFADYVWGLVKDKFDELKIKEEARPHSALADAFHALLTWEELRKKTSQMSQFPHSSFSREEKIAPQS